MRCGAAAMSRESSDARMERVVLSPVDVDPRSWFSNERTCIEWLHSAAILGASATALVSTGEPAARLAGVMLVVPALAVALHAARMHRVRAAQLDARTVSAHFDRVGPTLYAFPLAVAVMFNLLAAVAKWAWADVHYRPGAMAPIRPPAEYWTGGAALILALAVALLCPSSAWFFALAGAPDTAGGLAQPFLDGAARASASVGPLRPKLLYANERTFIHWSHTCTLLSSTAMAITSSKGLASFGAADGAADGAQPAGSLATLLAGVTLSCLALALLGYAHRTYFWRARAITAHSEARVDDPNGPPMLACVLLLAIGAGMAALVPKAMTA
jgi:uncharacterized membrane protein YidH (DUF202 family)